MKRKYLKLSFASVIISSVFLFSSCTNNAPQATTQPIPPQPVNTIVATLANEAISISYPAKLLSEEDVIIKAKVSGNITKKMFKAGDKVKKGQVLFAIEQDKYKAANEIAKGQYLVAKANFENAKQDYERNKILISKKAISQKEYDTSLASFRSAKANLSASEASYKSTQLDLDYSLVKAEFDGTIGDALVNIGEYVSAGVTQLVRLTNLDIIYAEFYISDKDKININKSILNNNMQIKDAKAIVNILDDEFVGELYFIDSIINSSAGVKAKAKFDNKINKLIPGTITSIRIDGFVINNVYKIPLIAVLQDQKGSFIYTLKDNKVTKNIVKIIHQDNEYAIITGDIKDKDKIIINNFKKIAIGATVQDIGSK